MSTTTRVLLMEDNPHQLEGLVACLKTLSTITLVEPIVSLAMFDQKAQEINSVDVIFVGIGLASALPSLIARIPLPQWIVLTASYHSSQIVAQAICAGANGAIAYDASCETYASCITQIVQQRCPYFSGDVAQSLKDHVNHYNIALSQTQRLVLAALAQQRTIADIVILIQQQAVAPQSVSVRTVYAHIDSILRSIHLVSKGR